MSPKQITTISAEICSHIKLMFTCLRERYIPCRWTNIFLWSHLTGFWFGGLNLANNDCKSWLKERLEQTYAYFLTGS